MNGRSSDSFGGGEETQDLNVLSQCVRDKSILITGAGGWIGARLAKAVNQAAPSRNILLDHSEHDLFQVCSDLTAYPSPGNTSVIPVLGDVGDERLLSALFERYRPEIVFHLAAIKHVSLAESNPFAAVRSNVIGTYRLASIARQYCARRLVMVSTDKAADPQSVMGASKRVAELVLLGLSNHDTAMKAVRFGNVLGSRGSVVPLFLQQIARGGPVTITHPEARRYFIDVKGALALVLAVAQMEAAQGIYIPEVRRQVRIRDLAERLIRGAGRDPDVEITFEIIGLRHGEKLSEDLISTRESVLEHVGNGLQLLDSPWLAEAAIDLAIRDLERCLDDFDLTAMLSTLGALIPEYGPSKLLLEAAGLKWREAEVF